MSDLRPCPFCGGKASYDKSYKIDCNDCGVSIERWADNRHGSNKKEVKKAWNNQPQLNAAIEALEEIVESDPSYTNPTDIAQQALSELEADNYGN